MLRFLLRPEVSRCCASPCLVLPRAVIVVAERRRCVFDDVKHEDVPVLAEQFPALRLRRLLDEHALEKTLRKPFR